MPAPELPRDLSAIPSFLRRGLGSAAGLEQEDVPQRPVSRLSLPRPANPPSAPASPGSRLDRLDPATLPMPSLSRRRVLAAAAILLAAWMAISFARQVSEATAATDRAAEMRAGNAALQAEVSQLQADLSRVQDRQYILIQGRAVGLGARGEIPFALAADAPSLPPDAPGSAAVRLGAVTTDESPLDAWLAALLGPSR
jgi:cell division protein FtsB